MNSNFLFLEAKYPLLGNLARLAENNLYTDPNTTLSKLRLFAEQIAKIIFIRLNLTEPVENTHNNRLFVLKNENHVPLQVIDFFHTIRRAGNKAVHEVTGTVEEAKTLLQLSFNLGRWFFTVCERTDVTTLKFLLPDKVNIDVKSSKLEQEYKLLEEKFNQLQKAKESAPIQITKEEIR